MDLVKNTVKTEKNTRMKYPKPFGCIISYFILLISFVLILAAVYGIDFLVATMVGKFL